MTIHYEIGTKGDKSISYSLLDDSGKLVGTVEGNISHGTLITVIHIYPPNQKKGLGFNAFEKVYTEINKKEEVKIIRASWHSGDEFAYCENGMSSNLKIFLNCIESNDQNECAFQTPTGKWAKKIGFNKCRISSISQEDTTIDFYKE